VHHSVILEFNGKSRRAEMAEERARGGDAPAQTRPEC